MSFASNLKRSAPPTSNPACPACPERGLGERGLGERSRGEPVRSELARPEPVEWVEWVEGLPYAFPNSQSA